jgi:hypothetical protein
MTLQIDKDTKTYAISCDTCSDSTDTECADFNEAKSFAKEHGWRTYIGPDKVWANGCPACTQDFARGRN